MKTSQRAIFPTAVALFLSLRPVSAQDPVYGGLAAGGNHDLAFLTKGYWKVIDDSGSNGEVWNNASWNAYLTNGCSLDVYVRADDDRQALAKGLFIPITNNVPLTNVVGRFLEVRAALSRDDASKQPLLFDLTLRAISPSN